MATQAQQDEYLNKLRQQMQTQMTQEIMSKMSEKCFKVLFISFLYFYISKSSEYNK